MSQNGDDHLFSQIAFSFALRHLLLDFLPSGNYFKRMKLFRRILVRISSIEDSVFCQYCSIFWLLQCFSFLFLWLSKNSNKFSFQRKSLKKHSNVNELYIFEIVNEFSRGKMSQNFIKKSRSCFWQKSSIQNGFQTSKTTK